MDWIRTDYDFGLRMQGIFIPGMLIRNWGFHAFEILRTPETAQKFLEKLPIKDIFPTDAYVVRINLPVDKDGINIYLASKLFPAVGQGEIIKIVPIEDFIKEDWEKIKKCLKN